MTGEELIKFLLQIISENEEDPILALHKVKQLLEETKYYNIYD